MFLVGDRESGRETSTNSLKASQDSNFLFLPTPHHKSFNSRSEANMIRMCSTENVQDGQPSSYCFWVTAPRMALHGGYCFSRSSNVWGLLHFTVDCWLFFFSFREHEIPPCVPPSWDTIVLYASLFSLRLIALYRDDNACVLGFRIFKVSFKVSFEFLHFHLYTMAIVRDIKLNSWWLAF